MTHYVDGFMRIAFEEARQALRDGEVPVGCVLVHRRENEAQYEAEQSTKKSCSSCSTSSCSGEEERSESCARRVAARGRNATNAQRHALAHAEFMAVEALLADTDNTNTEGSSCSNDDLNDLSAWVLYVTVEPCIMCAAFLLYNRIGHVFYGCANSRFGGNGSILALHDAAQNRLHTCCTQRNSEDTASTTTNTATTAGESNVHAHGEGCGLWGYPSEGGHRKQEAIALLQAFYKRENPFAPGHKRRRKGEAASASDQDNDNNNNDDDDPDTAE